MKNFKLTQKDKEYLLSIGYLKSDLAQIEKGINIGKITKKKRIKGTKNYNTKEITILTAIRNVGREQFLSSCGRASFHWSTSDVLKECSEKQNSYLYGYSDELISYDFSKLFE